MPPSDPAPTPAELPVADEQLWSWVDRDAPELDSHLAAHPEDRGRVDSIRRAIRAVAGEEVVDRTPSSIGDYTILRRLGSGGMGVVFEAEQARPKRRVALKVIRGAWLDDATTRRLFYREAEVLARLNHPGIAQIFEAGETKEGAPYFVMELSQGVALDRWAAGEGRSAPPSFERRMEVFERICRAVHHAHEKGVVHRDLKPSNVLVEEGDRPKVLDFGLARVIDPDTNVSLTAAVTGRVVGTVRYMSPEQARGLASRATATSDVYSLGVLLYELLTGRLPHDFEGTSIFEAARKVASDPIPAPSTVLPPSRARFPASYDAIVMQALAKEPGARYASAFALADDVRRALEGAPVTATPPKARVRLEELGAKAGRALGAAAAAAAAAAREAHAAANRPEAREQLRRAAKNTMNMSRVAGEHARRAGQGALAAATSAHATVQAAAVEASNLLRGRASTLGERLRHATARLRAQLSRCARGLGQLALTSAVLGVVLSWFWHDSWLTPLRARLDRASDFSDVDTRRFEDVSLYHEPVRQVGFPTVAPWDGVRWQGEQPVVRVLGQWSLLESIEGVDARALVAAIRGTAPDAAPAVWQAEFEERLAEHLYPFLGAHDPDRALDLVLRRNAEATPVTVAGVPAHARNVDTLTRLRWREQKR